MKISIILLVLLISTVSNAQNQDQATPQHTDVIILNSDNLQFAIYSSEEPWLLDLYAPWCGHCMQMTKEWQKLATKLKGTVNVAKIDASEYPQFNQLYGLKGFPHIVFIPAAPKNKQLFYVHNGPRTADAFEKWTLQKIDEHKRSSFQRLTDEKKWIDICIGPHSDFCVLFFLPKVTESSTNQQRDLYLTIISGVMKKYSRQPVSFLWTQKGDHSHIQQKLNVGQQLPAVVLINPTTKRFSVMPKSFTQDDFQHWLDNTFDIEFSQFDGELIFGNQQSQSQTINVNSTSNEL